MPVVREGTSQIERRPPCVGFPDPTRVVGQTCRGHATLVVAEATSTPRPPPVKLLVLPRVPSDRTCPAHLNAQPRSPTIAWDRWFLYREASP